MPRLERLVSKYLTRFAISALAFAVVVVVAFNIFTLNERFVEASMAVPNSPVFDKPVKVGTAELAWKEIVALLDWSVYK